MLRVGVVFAWALLACQVSTYGRSSSTPSSPPPSPSPSDGEASSPATVTVPDVNQLETADDAKNVLRAAGLTGNMIVAYDHDDPTNEIACGTKPDANQRVPHDMEITIIFCVEPRKLPGMTVDAAKAEIARMSAAIHAHGAHRVETVDGTCAHGTVCSVAPSDWADGDTDVVTLTVGK